MRPPKKDRPRQGGVAPTEGLALAVINPSLNNAGAKKVRGSRADRAMVIQVLGPDPTPIQVRTKVDTAAPAAPCVPALRRASSDGFAGPLLSAAGPTAAHKRAKASPIFAQGAPRPAPGPSGPMAWDDPIIACPRPG